MVPPASRRIPRVLRYSGSRLYFVLSSTGLLPSLEPLSFGLRLELFRLHDPATPIDRSLSVWPLTISLAATKVIEFSFSSSGYLDVSVHRVPFRTLWIGVRMTGVLPAGFPHSDICGSKIICISPQLFAAYHVFLRLLVPRHPPCALFCLIICNIFACERITYAHARVSDFHACAPPQLFAHVHIPSPRCSLQVFHCSSLAIALAISLKNFTVVIKILKRIS